ncbi:hypothetical protein [uncultured Tessaracoccus sp.]|uniref:hypothetical protein n=1 Tax=uncultured Tessaracoccus sp. TaxID=905023 RepID=UPI0025E04A2A|nr:hypothetical protein [uncultured Tessaracoccus sp.]
MTDPQRFAIELGRALTGEVLPLSSPEIDDMVSELADLGWNAGAIAELRRERQDAGEPWPFPVHRDHVATVGFAVFHSRLEALRARLGVTGLRPQQRVRRALNAEERRLAAERPPHWG